MRSGWARVWGLPLGDWKEACWTRLEQRERRGSHRGISNGWGGDSTSSWSLLHTFRAAAPPVPQFSLCSEKAALISLSLSQSGAAPPPQARPQQASSSLLLLASFDSLPRETFLKQDRTSGLLSPEPESALVRWAGPQQEGAATAGQACYPEAAPRRGPLQCADPK